MNIYSFGILEKNNYSYDKVIIPRQEEESIIATKAYIKDNRRMYL